MPSARKSRTAENGALFLLIAYSLDLIWKLAHWNEITAGFQVPWRSIALPLGIRSVVMGGFLWFYLHARKSRLAGEQNTDTEASKG